MFKDRNFVQFWLNKADGKVFQGLVKRNYSKTSFTKTFPISFSIYTWKKKGELNVPVQQFFLY